MIFSTFKGVVPTMATWAGASMFQTLWTSIAASPCVRCPFTTRLLADTSRLISDTKTCLLSPVPAGPHGGSCDCSMAPSSQAKGCETATPLSAKRDCKDDRAPGVTGSEYMRVVLSPSSSPKWIWTASTAAMLKHFSYRPPCNTGGTPADPCSGPCGCSCAGGTPSAPGSSGAASGGAASAEGAPGSSGGALSTSSISTGSS